MKRELLINANPRETRVAILEDDQLVELQVDRPEARRMVGDIYWGRVEAVLPGLQAAFVDIGTDKSAFLHNSDLVYEEDDDDDAADDVDEPVDVEQPDSVETATVEAPAAGPSKPRGGRRRRKEPPQIQDVLKK